MKISNPTYLLIHNPGWTKAQIRIKEYMIKDLRLMMMPSGIRYDADKVQSSPGDPMLLYVERLDTLETELRNLIERHLKEQQDLHDMISLLPDQNEAAVLSARYINGMKYEQIADDIPAGIASVYRWHRVGLRHLDDIVKQKHDSI